MALSSAKTALENRNNDLVKCQGKIQEFLELEKFKKAMRLEGFSSIDNERRSKVQHLLNRIANMQRAVDEQAIRDMVENLTEEVLEDNRDTNVGRRQVQLEPPRICIFLPSSLVGIATDFKEQLLLSLDHNLFLAIAPSTIPRLEEMLWPLEDEVAIAAIANGVSMCESLQMEFGRSCTPKPIEQTSELQLLF